MLLHADTIEVLHGNVLTKLPWGVPIRFALQLAVLLRPCMAALPGSDALCCGPDETSDLAILSPTFCTAHILYHPCYCQRWREFACTPTLARLVPGLPGERELAAPARVLCLPLRELDIVMANASFRVQLSLCARSGGPFS